MVFDGGRIILNATNPPRESCREFRISRDAPLMLQWLLELLGGPPAGAVPGEEQLEALVELAGQHRVLAEVLEAWRGKHAAGTWPAPPPGLAAAARQAKVRSHYGAGWMARLGRRLSDAGIDYVALKGPTLSALIYGDPARRAFRDIDILVAPDRFSAAVGVAESLGWKAPSEWQRIRRIVGKFDLQLIGTEPFQPILEVHSQLFGSHIRSPSFYDIETAHIRLGDVSAPTLAPAEQIGYVALHGAKHFWFRLMWLYDLKRLIGTSQLPLDHLLHAARRSDAEAALLAGTMLCRSHLGLDVSLPEPSGRNVHKRAERIARWAAERLEMGPDAPETPLWHVRERLVSDRPASAIVRSLVTFARPAEVDVRALGAERPIMMHYLARPLFWIRRRASSRPREALRGGPHS
jgi:hypothetical protein